LFRIISINAYFLSHQTDNKEDKTSSNDLFGRLAYDHFKNTIDVRMMHQDMSVAPAAQRQWCCLHLSFGTHAATSNSVNVTIKDGAEATCPAAITAAATTIPPQTAMPCCRYCYHYLPHCQHPPQTVRAAAASSSSKYSDNCNCVPVVNDKYDKDDNSN
jgi:hypothetical protein